MNCLREHSKQTGGAKILLKGLTLRAKMKAATFWRRDGSLKTLRLFISIHVVRSCLLKLLRANAVKNGVVDHTTNHTRS